VHPRTRKIIDQNRLDFGRHIKVIEPVGYLEMLALESACSMVLTDSGGVQKEAYFFKKPCVTMRDSTEWVELVQSGWNILTGADSEKIIWVVRNFRIPENRHDFYGDGQTARKIIEELEK
jgi:UDP-GlcNAc3NAcA epimerase